MSNNNNLFRNLRQTNSVDSQSESGSNRSRRPLSHHETTDDDSSDYSLTDDESLDGTIKQKVRIFYYNIICYNIIIIIHLFSRLIVIYHWRITMHLGRQMLH